MPERVPSGKFTRQPEILQDQREALSTFIGGRQKLYTAVGTTGTIVFSVDAPLEQLIKIGRTRARVDASLERGRQHLDFVNKQINTEEEQLALDQQLITKAQTYQAEIVMGTKQLTQLRTYAAHLPEVDLKHLEQQHQALIEKENTDPGLQRGLELLKQKQEGERIKAEEPALQTIVETPKPAVAPSDVSENKVRQRRLPSTQPGTVAAGPAQTAAQPNSEIEVAHAELHELEELRPRLAQALQPGGGLSNTRNLDDLDSEITAKSAEIAALQASAATTLPTVEMSAQITRLSPAQRKVAEAVAGGPSTAKAITWAEWVEKAYAQELRKGEITYHVASNRLGATKAAIEKKGGIAFVKVEATNDQGRSETRYYLELTPGVAPSEEPASLVEEDVKKK